jgi:hypothetical protein
MSAAGDDGADAAIVKELEEGEFAEAESGGDVTGESRAVGRLRGSGEDDGARCGDAGVDGGEMVTEVSA